MAKYLVRASYSTDGARAVLKEGGSSRDAVRGLIEGLGGSLDAFYFAFVAVLGWWYCDEVPGLLDSAQR